MVYYGGLPQTFGILDKGDVNDRLRRLADRGSIADVGASSVAANYFFDTPSMAITRQAKELTLTGLREKLQRTKGLIFTHYQGLTVKDVTELRKTLRQHEVELVVAKKTLLKKALADSGYDADLVERLEGSIAIAFGYTDEITPAKLLQAFAKDHPAVELIGGVVNGQVLSPTEAVALSKLPGRDELRAKLVWVLGSPMSGLVNVTAGTLRGLINVLQAIKDKQPAPAGV